MRLSPVDEPLLHMILSTVHPAETVREKMMIRLKTLPTRTYLQYNSTMNKTIMVMRNVYEKSNIYIKNNEEKGGLKFLFLCMNLYVMYVCISL